MGYINNNPVAILMLNGKKERNIDIEKEFLS